MGSRKAVLGREEKDGLFRSYAKSFDSFRYRVMGQRPGVRASFIGAERAEISGAFPASGRISSRPTRAPSTRRSPPRTTLLRQSPITIP